MKRNHYLRIVPLAGALLWCGAASADQDVTNRLTLSARFGYNISTRFNGFSTGTPPAPRTTPRGDAYNYDDGYVLTDISGNFGGQTWYWGYDSSARQIAGDTILLNRSAALPSSGTLESEPYLGFELSYNRELGRGENLRYGLEAAVNYMNFTAQDNRSFATRVTDAYPFTPGTTPPTATPGNPYQGSFEGPGFVIGDTPVSSTITTLGQRRLDSDIWGFRLGPYLEMPLGKRLNLSVSGGLAVGLLDNTASWTQTISTTGSASTSSVISGSDFAVAWGGYVSANLTWQLCKRCSAVGGVQFQDLGTYEHSFNGQSVALDLRDSVFVVLGLSYNF